VKRTALTTTIVVSALILAACGGGGDEETTPSTSEASTSTSSTTSTTSSTTSTTSSTTSTTSTTLPDILRMPLTGEPIDDVSAIPDRPALVVKITNAGPQPLPQAGLNNADIVIEEVINDSVSRLAAIFHSMSADPVGPIRSGRAQDINILLSLNRPLFAWSGGNPAVTRAISGSDLIDLSAVKTPGYYRRSGRKQPNDLYSSTDVLWERTTEEAGRPTPIFPYLRPGEEVTGDEATSIEVLLDSTRASWSYDAETGRYYRRQNGDIHNTESSDGLEQVWADNVVVMMADYGVNTFDGNPDAQVLGSNPVFVFTQGTVRVGEWLRFEPEDPFALYDNFDDLNELGLTPGRTWMEIPRLKAEIADTLTWE
jgi:hypothetical protein